MKQPIGSISHQSIKHIMKALAFLFSFTFITCSPLFAQDTIHWRSDYKLKWEDFRGKPDTNSQYAAISSPAISFTLTYNETSFSYKVFCYFNKSKSWSLSKNQNLLSHEQGHFDIAELFARKLRKAFKNYKLNPATIQSDFNKVYNKIREERDKLDNLYDKETNLSRNKVKQLYWTKKIIFELKKLEEYKE